MGAVEQAARTTPMSYFVYILASKKHGTLYIGVCNDMRSRLELHRTGKGSQFVKKYGVTRLVYMEDMRRRWKRFSGRNR
jgi:predicted GIY-YIG superfamily endonuclease